MRDPVRLGPRYWQARYRRWPKRGASSDGYSLLVPVPGDLPVFLRLALAVCRHQDPASRLETLVVPDRVTPLMKDIVAQARPDWPGALRLQPLPVPERWVLPRLGNPGRNHASQLIAGVSHALGTHIVLHDADLFLLSRDLHRRQFEMCRQRQLACLGISPPWDPWFAEHGRELAATWELCAQVAWLRSFAPVLHMAHQNEMFGEQHMFDTTFYPQALSDPALIAVSPTEDFVHFNYVISNYRHFVRPRTGPWPDNRFRLLLVRLLVEIFDHEGAGSYQLPSLAELGGGLGVETGPVKFPERQKGEQTYRSFRDLMGRALTGPWVDDVRRQLAAGALAPFDRFYGCEGAQLFPVGAAATGEGPVPGGSPAGG